MIALLIILIFFSAFLSGSETSLFSLSQMTLKSYQGSSNHKKQLIASLMSHPRDVLVTLLMLNMLVNILVQNTVANLTTSESWAFKVGMPLALILIFGEILPKSIALSKNTFFAPLVAPFLQFAAKVLKPIRVPITRITSAISRFFFLFLKKEETISIEELRHILEGSEQSGILLEQECDLIGGALDLQQSIVKERMRPRSEIVYFNSEDPLSDLVSLFVDLETTRVLVCDGDLENLIGILSTKQFFLHRDQIHSAQDLKSLLKKPYFIPETMKAWNCLKNLRALKKNLAVVVDEYGSISGLISQEDLIEAVVGDIRDRRDPIDLYTRSGKDVIIASGKLELSEFKEIFGIALKSRESIVTLGGWLVDQLGDIPTAGTQFATDHFLFHVLAADPNRISRIYVRNLKTEKR